MGFIYQKRILGQFALFYWFPHQINEPAYINHFVSITFVIEGIDRLWCGGSPPPSVVWPVPQMCDRCFPLFPCCACFPCSPPLPSPEFGTMHNRPYGSFTDRAMRRASERTLTHVRISEVGNLGRCEICWWSIPLRNLTKYFYFYLRFSFNFPAASCQY